MPPYKRVIVVPLNPQPPSSVKTVRQGGGLIHSNESCWCCDIPEQAFGIQKICDQWCWVTSRDVLENPEDETFLAFSVPANG